MYFFDRKEAGEKLGKLLGSKYTNKNMVIYALPRGGVVTADEVAKILHAPIDIIITRKIGHPFEKEYALAVVSESKQIIGDPQEIAKINQDWFHQQVEKETKEIERRKKLYLRGRKPIHAKNKIAVIVDDGIATGLTMKAAIADLKEKGHKKIVVAVPVMPKEIAQELQTTVSDIVALDVPDEYAGAVGSYYKNFPQVTDEEVISILSQQNTDPLLFSLPDYQDMAKELILQLSDFSQGQYALKRFANQELYLELLNSVDKKSCFILGDFAPPDKRFIEISLLSHTLKKGQAKGICGIFPYLAYSRHDKEESEKSLGALWAGELLAASGITSIITLDVHSEEATKLFSLPIISLSPAKLFANKIKELQLDEVSIIAPDEGAKKRCQAVAQEIGIEDIAYTTKKRTENEVVTESLVGIVTKQAIIIDDILDTGSTLIGCCKKLKEKGAEEITIFATHGLFTGDNWPDLLKLGVKNIFCTNTLPFGKRLQKQYPLIQILSINPLLSEELKVRKEKAYV